MMLPRFERLENTKPRPRFFFAPGTTTRSVNHDKFVVMLRPLKRVARQMLEQASAYRPLHRDALDVNRLEHSGPPEVVSPARQHLDEAIAWIKRAQDAAGDTGGVAWGYRARAPLRSGAPVGWAGPYPETTGYIISTMLRYAKATGDARSTEAARRMAEWELAIQLADGGFQGGIYGERPVSSSTFVTGQVLFGLVDAFREWPSQRYRDAAIRGADFLLDCLDGTGRFIKGYSYFCASGSKAYEARTGLALAELGILLGQESYKQAASRMADYALSCQQRNGWFNENDLDEHDQPLTHTIGYVLEGLYGIGMLLHRSDCLDAVRRSLDSIAKFIRPNGFLPGRFRSDWSSPVHWACLTGSAQIAGVYLRMYRAFGDSADLETSRRLLGFVCWTQETKRKIPSLSGGISGSYPFDGGYGPWCLLNWATKFFADSLMDYLGDSLPAA